jgi:hypothetical protein
MKNEESNRNLRNQQKSVKEKDNSSYSEKKYRIAGNEDLALLIKQINEIPESKMKEDGNVFAFGKAEKRKGFGSFYWEDLSRFEINKASEEETGQKKRLIKGDIYRPAKDVTVSVKEKK